jgi:hypothetical protein
VSRIMYSASEAAALPMRLSFEGVDTCLLQSGR